MYFLNTPPPQFLDFFVFLNQDKKSENMTFFMEEISREEKRSETWNFVLLVAHLKSSCQFLLL